MTKKPVTAKTENTETTEEVMAEIDQALIDKAVEAGRNEIADGKSKIEAAMVIYRMLETVDQQTVIGALVKGASLTPMGATTYWYNCRRRIAQERRTQTNG